MTESDGRAVPRRRVRLSEEQRRDQIVQAAVKLFAAHGYARTTTRDIAREAGISEGTIYRYFESKQDLLFSFIASTVLESLQSRLAEWRKADEGEALRRLFEDRLTLAQRHGPLMKVAIGEALFDPELARAIAEGVSGPAVALLRSFISEHISAGRFRDIDPEVAARAMVGSFMAFAVLWPVLLPRGRRRQTPRRLAEALASLFLDGLRAPAKESAR
jgi:AcrR family transcriptional regulator